MEDFIKLSQDGMDDGAHIMHRFHSTTVDIVGNRAVAKMKATVTKRFLLDGCLVDAEMNCRFCMFLERRGDRCGACFIRHFYEKDKLLPVGPRKIPTIDDEKLNRYPEGYRYLSYCQSVTIPGFKPLPLPDTVDPSTISCTSKPNNGSMERISKCKWIYLAQTLDVERLGIWWRYKCARTTFIPL